MSGEIRFAAYCQPESNPMKACVTEMLDLLSYKSTVSFCVLIAISNCTANVAIILITNDICTKSCHRTRRPPAVVQILFFVP